MCRFAEQSYLLLYYTIYWTWGVRLFIQETPATLLKSSSGAESWISSILISLWTNFPKLYVEAAMKFYYLSQLAFWAQQIVVIHLEERRHDHYQMLTHHFVTVALMSTSYAYRQWRVGNAVLACMDIVDLVFPVSRLAQCLEAHTDATLSSPRFFDTCPFKPRAMHVSPCSWSPGLQPDTSPISASAGASTLTSIKSRCLTESTPFVLLVLTRQESASAYHLKAATTSGAMSSSPSSTPTPKLSASMEE